MYKKILVPVDGSEPSKAGLAEAIRLAKQLNAAIRILHVVDELIPGNAPGALLYYDKWVEALREEGQKTLKAAASFAQNQDIEADTLLVETAGARAADAIVEQAKRWPADLIVLGTHGRRGVRRLLMGSDAELVVRSASTPVLLVGCAGAR